MNERYSAVKCESLSNRIMAWTASNRYRHMMISVVPFRIFCGHTNSFRVFFIKLSGSWVVLGTLHWAYSHYALRERCLPSGVIKNAIQLNAFVHQQCDRVLEYKPRRIPGVAQTQVRCTRSWFRVFVVVLEGFSLTVCIPRGPALMKNSPRMNACVWRKHAFTINFPKLSLLLLAKCLFFSNIRDLLVSSVWVAAQSSNLIDNSCYCTIPICAIRASDNCSEKHVHS